MENIQDTIQSAKENMPDVTPTPPSLKRQSSSTELKSRLDWGEPALTIVDVRDRHSFNEERIMGAIAMPMAELVERAQSSLEPTRDIYVYGESDEETAQAATHLREAGFVNVAELKGGLAGWKAISAPTEGTATIAAAR
ncbi:MAG: rhodanese-like domain-containing protein [Coleofasciculaceae cyanobacterium]